MNKRILTALAVIFSVAIFQSCNESLIQDENLNSTELKSANQAKKSYIVVLNDGELNNELSNLKGYEKKQAAVNKATAKILKRAGVSDGEIGHVYGNSIKGFSVKIPPGQLKKLQDDPSVSFIEEDQIVTLGDPFLHPNKPGNGGSKKPGGGGGGGSITEEMPYGITRVNGGVVYSGTARAWIIDTGIDLNHPDLNVDVANSRNFVTRESSPDDLNGHGTHVSGTIGAIKGNNLGVVGVAAGVKVVAVRVLNRRGSGSYSDVIAGIDYVAAAGKSGDVANMSLGGPVSTALDNAVLAASQNVKFALAAGNEGDDANNHSPARVNGPNIVTISAMDSKDKMPYWSNWGNPPVDYCEPGVGIKSTWKDGGYNTISGTSMATPHAAGLLLLGSIKNGGTVSGDPDGHPDTIGVH